MDRWFRSPVGVLALSLALALMVAYAYAPLADIGFVSEDFEILGSAAEAIEEGPNPGQAFSIAGTQGHPLAGLSVLASQALWSDEGDWSERSPLPLRLENLLLLALAAWGLALFVRRLLRPWTGSDQATAASWAVTYFVLLYPFHVADVAHLAARPTLLSAALGAWSGASFLRARQERRAGLIFVAAALALGAALSGGIGLCLPLLLGGAEFVSSHRYRPARTRLRTALNTLLVFSGCVGIDMLLRSANARAFRGPSFFESLAEVEGPTGGLRAIIIGIEKLGLALLPVNVAGLGILGYVIVGVLVLAALQPALIAARSAPRLWGWILLSWTVLLGLSVIPDFDVRVHPGDLSRTWVLLPMSLVMAVGTAVAATALPGRRRLILPAGFALSLAVLAHANALPWVTASREVEIMMSDLRLAREAHGTEVDLLVIDPGGRTRRVDALGDALPWLVHPNFAGDVPFDESTERWVRSIEGRALGAFVREPEFDAARASGLVLLAPIAAQPARGLSSRRHRALRVAPAERFEPLSPWYGEGRSPALDLDPSDVRALVVRLEVLPDSGGPEVARPRLGWRARPAGSASAPNPGADGDAHGELEGAWVRGPGVLEAVFDFHDSVEWLCGGRLRRLWSAAGWAAIEQAQLIQELPELAPGLLPEVDGDDWLFRRAAHRPLVPERESVALRLALFDVSSYELREFSAQLTPSGDLRVPGAEAAVARTVRRAGGPVAWTLAATVDGVAFAESHGRRRRVGRRGSEEER